jgi:hypothetical protein
MHIDRIMGSIGIHAARTGAATEGRRAGRLRAVSIALAIGAVLHGCSDQIQIGDLGETAGGDPEVASRMVERWFELARSGAEDSGWWVLYPNVRSDIIGSMEVYRDAFATVDWSTFDQQVVGGRLNDGQYRIDVHVAGGRANVPQPLCRWGLIQFAPGLNGEPSEIGAVTVRIPPFGGEAGIVGGAGC